MHNHFTAPRDDSLRKVPSFVLCGHENWGPQGPLTLPRTESYGTAKRTECLNPGLPDAKACALFTPLPASWWESKGLRHHEAVKCPEEQGQLRVSIYGSCWRFLDSTHKKVFIVTKKCDLFPVAFLVYLFYKKNTFERVMNKRNVFLL